MALSAPCVMTAEDVQHAFLAAPPLLSKSILDLSIKHPNWLRDLPDVEDWPLGNGTSMDQLIYRGSLPQIERGFQNWKQLGNNTGCDPCDGPNCAYNWTVLGGNSLERRRTSLMERDFKSTPFCVNEIQHTAHFEELFAKIVENLYAQIDFFKEQNIAFNYLTGLAKKYIVDSDGAKANTQNLYQYRPLGTATISTLNINLLEFFYEWMVKIPDAIPYDVVDGAPLFGLMASRQLLGHLYRDDSNLRQDARFSGAANALLTKYNFQSTIRGMFIPAPILFPRRFDVDGNGIVYEVFPYVNGIPAEIGSFTGFNPAYEDAEFEEVLLHGKHPFKLFTLATAQTLGQNTSFGAEYSYFNSWQWVNPQTVEDPARRVGFFFTNAKIALAAQYSEGIFGVLVSRPRKTLMATYLPEASCPPEEVECDNSVPGLGCPCPLILGFTENPITDGNFFINLAVGIDSDVAPDDEVQFGVDTGGYVTGTIEAISADRKSVEVSFTSLDINCDRFTSLFCSDTLGCSAHIEKASLVEGDVTRLSLILSYPVKGSIGETLSLYEADGTAISVTIISFDWLTNTLVVDGGATNLTDEARLVVSVCVPPATDASCPACGGTTFADCEDS